LKIVGFEKNRGERKKDTILPNQGVAQAKKQKKPTYQKPAVETFKEAEGRG